jgi:prephenate dehydrogenase
MLPEVMAAVKPGAVVTDVGSTKCSIVALGEKEGAQRGRVFIGSHPMAGSEKSGVRFAREDLFEGATCFVTKTHQSDLSAFARVGEFWRALEARLVVLRPARHDELAALASHLPHVVAVALVSAIAASGEDKNLVKGIVGGGFRDTTRIAAGNTEMWDDICSDNNAAIQRAEKLMAQGVAAVLAAQQAGDSEALRRILRDAAEYREFLDNR